MTFTRFTNNRSGSLATLSFALVVGAFAGACAPDAADSAAPAAQTDEQVSSALLRTNPIGALR